MQKYDLCCIGHITLDKVVTPHKTVYMPGGTSFYCSHAIRHFNDINFGLIASLAKSELDVVKDLEAKGVAVNVIYSNKSVYFENVYGENQDDRTQRVLAKADPFVIEDIENIDAKIYFLGALLSDDFSLEFVEKLSQKGLVAVDSQGYLRKVEDEKVFAIDWHDKKKFLKYVHFLKVNEMELEVLTGESDIQKASKMLHHWGVNEVVVTLGSMGSVIYDGTNFYPIPAYKPADVVDATGCGDTYMTGYLYKRALGKNYTEAAEFGAAMATIKIENTGPFCGQEKDVLERISHSEKTVPIIAHL